MHAAEGDHPSHASLGERYLCTLTFVPAYANDTPDLNTEPRRHLKWCISTSSPWPWVLRVERHGRCAASRQHSHSLSFPLIHLHLADPPPSVRDLALIRCSKPTKTDGSTAIRPAGRIDQAHSLYCVSSSGASRGRDHLHDHRWPGLTNYTEHQCQNLSPLPRSMIAASFEQHRGDMVRSCSACRIRPAGNNALNQSCLCGTGMALAMPQGYHVQFSRHVSPGT